MKHILLMILFTMTAVSSPLCNTEVFKVSVIIPQIVGVNYFPEEADILARAGEEKLVKDTSEQTIMRNGKKLLLKTTIAK